VGWASLAEALEVIPQTFGLITGCGQLLNAPAFQHRGEHLLLMPQQRPPPPPTRHLPCHGPSAVTLRCLHQKEETFIR
jgi:hypothetical protein